MKQERIVVTSPSFSANETLKTELLSFFPESSFNSAGERLQGENLAERIRGADGAVVGLEPVDEPILKECRTLKVIAKFGVGLDNVDLEACAKRKIDVRYTPGCNRLSVAEMVLSFMIALSRNIFSTSNQLKSGTWNKSGGANLSGKTIGIIGVGNIGKELVRLLKPFGCRILVNDIIDQRDFYRRNRLKEVPKEEIFRKADIVTVHTPLTDLTKHLINRETLNMMKGRAFVINTARGAIVKSDELGWALRNGIIAGAAVDVYEKEPPDDMDLLGLPNLICTPHIGGNSLESVLAMGRSAIGHLVDYFGAEGVSTHANDPIEGKQRRS